MDASSMEQPPVAGLDERELADFFLIRELGRRPRSQNSAETLGFASSSTHDLISMRRRQTRGVSAAWPRRNGARS